MEKTFDWYNVTAEFLTEDEKTGKIKKVKENYLVKGVTPGDVETQVHKDLEGTQMEYSITNIGKSKILRVMHPETVALNG